MNLTIPEEFPWKESERQLVKKKILMFLAWCSSQKPCPPSCPFAEHCSENSGDTDRITHLLSWIMEAEI